MVSIVYGLHTRGIWPLDKLKRYGLSLLYMARVYTCGLKISRHIGVSVNPKTWSLMSLSSMSLEQESVNPYFGVWMPRVVSSQCVRPQRPDTALTKKPSTEPLAPYGLRGGNGGGGDVFDKQICFDLTKCLADQLHVT